MEINDKLLDELLAQAGTNERRRINCLLYTSDAADE